MISVVIPTYQHAKTIMSCVESLLTQTLAPGEVIVIDDGSTDKTMELLRRFETSITYQFQPNQGAPNARNAGAEIATGTFLFFCDADIQAKSTMLEKFSTALENHPEFSYAYSGFFWGHKRFKTRPFDAQALRQRNYIHTASLIRREAFPGFDPSLKRLQDWDLYLTMLENGHTGVAIDEELFTVLEAPGRTGMSSWLPSIAYRLPWDVIGWKPGAIEDFEEAERIIKVKHRLV